MYQNICTCNCHSLDYSIGGTVTDVWTDLGSADPHLHFTSNRILKTVSIFRVYVESVQMHVFVAHQRGCHAPACIVRGNTEPCHSSTTVLFGLCFIHATVEPYEPRSPLPTTWRWLDNASCCRRNQNRFALKWFRNCETILLVHICNTQRLVSKTSSAWSLKAA